MRVKYFLGPRRQINFAEATPAQTYLPTRYSLSLWITGPLSGQAIYNDYARTMLEVW